MTAKYGTLYIDKILDTEPREMVNPGLKGGTVKVSTENFSIANGDAANDTYFVARVPRNGIPLAVAGLSIKHSADMPDEIDLGDVSNPDGLIDDYDGSSAAATHDFSPAIADAGKTFWELLGYATEDAAPVDIDLYITLKTSGGASAAATGVVEIQYRVE